VDVNPNIERVLHALPGANCGACGMAGCASLAEAIVNKKAEITACAPGGQEAYNNIAKIVEIEVKVKQKRIARIRCNGGKRSLDKYEYSGLRKCAGVYLLASGQKKCRFACLGFGDCVIMCPFDAIRLNENNIPVVDGAKCTACGKCVQACPKKIIVLENVEHKVYVKCLSHDKGVVVKSICPVGCIGCKICEKLSNSVFTVENNLSRVEYSRAKSDTPWQVVVEKCPTKCIAWEEKCQPMQ
jgi:Na+-translocating ferredoxin:NAD+ oxidoreductase RNF subunit RnfB